MTTLEQCRSGAAAVGFSYGAGPGNVYTSEGNLPPYCARIWSGAGQFFLNFDSAGSNTGDCDGVHTCVCFERPTTPTTPTTPQPSSPTTSPPSGAPTIAPTTFNPTTSPTTSPTSGTPTTTPTYLPTTSPTSGAPTISPTYLPTTAPTGSPTLAFAVSPACEQERAANEAYAQDRADYYVGESTTLSGFRGANCRNPSEIFDGHIANRSTISFRIEIESANLDEDYDVCISDRTGRATITILGNMAEGYYAARLVARDEERERDGTGIVGIDTVIVAAWTMRVQTRGDFVALSSNQSGCSGGDTGPTQLALHQDVINAALAPGFLDNDTIVVVPGFSNMVKNATQWTLSGCPVADMFDHYSTTSTGLPDISFAVRIEDWDTGGLVSEAVDTLSNPDSAKMSLTMVRPGRYRVWLQAATARTGTARVGVVSTEIHVRTGPNGNACGDKGAAVHNHVDPSAGIRTNDTYRCECHDQYSGDTCEISPVATAAAGDSADAALVGIGLGSVILVTLALLVTHRVQLYSLKHRPCDMDEMQGDVLDGIGIRLPTDVKDHEFGVMLTFNTNLDPASTEGSGLVELERMLVSTLSKHLPRLTEELKHSRIITSHATPNQLLMVIPRSRGYSKQSDVAERAVAALSQQAEKHKLLVGANAVSSLTLAIPSRIPRELRRAQLTRITMLGEGAFGEVGLYLIDESKRGIPPYKAAVKTVKPGASVGRDELLKEAALMAMLDHRYVLGLIGVVTTPRDLPALVILMFCEGGELVTHVSDAGRDGLSATDRLTYASQIALGMQYISTRSIVHRDLAARNVLLDSMRKCRVSDFGMSTSLVKTGKVYAAKYVRMHEEIALRWASPEALQHEKFSTASDVWAYGVLVWEVFACGVSEPYGDHGLGEVGAFIKAGGKPAALPRNTCPSQVYDELMLPCWRANPNARPTFGELYDICVLHGAVEDQVTLDQRAAKGPLRTGRGSLVGDLRYLAPSVRYLSGTLVPELHLAVGPGVEANLAGRGDPDLLFPLLDAGEANSYHVKDSIVVPATRDVTCKRDGQPGAIFVDTLSGGDNVGPATAILSYAWKYPLRLMAGALDDWCSAGTLDPTRQYVWIDVLCWNQHGRLSDPVAEWTPRVEAIGHQLTMLHPWNRPIYTTRAWCIFELWYAIGLGATCNLGIILAPEDRAAFHAAIKSRGYGVVDEALGHIRAESAEAFSADDLASITAKVQSTPGGFDTLNGVVKQRLQQWFESQGGIKVASDLSFKLREGSATSYSRASHERSMPMKQLSEDEQYRSYEDIIVGDRVTVSGHQGAAVVRFVGVVNTQRTHGRSRVGVDLDSPNGKHNGTVDGRQYFKCAEKHGLLVPRERVRLLAHKEASLSSLPEFGFGTAEPANSQRAAEDYMDVQDGGRPGTGADASHAGFDEREEAGNGNGGHLGFDDVAEYDEYEI